MSTSIGDLKEPFRTKAHAFYDELCRDQQLKDAGAQGIIILETLRSLEVHMAYFSRLLASYTPAKYRKHAVAFVQKLYEQAGLYKISATDAIKPITWTMQSKHLGGEAFDLWPSKEGKRIWWAPADWEGWARMAEIAKDYAIDAGYLWEGNEQDCPHFQEVKR